MQPFGHLTPIVEDSRLTLKANRVRFGWGYGFSQQYVQPSMHIFLICFLIGTSCLLENVNLASMQPKRNKQHKKKANKTSKKTHCFNSET